MSTNIRSICLCFVRRLLKNWDIARCVSLSSLIGEFVLGPNFAAECHSRKDIWIYNGEDYMRLCLLKSNMPEVTSIFYSCKMSCNVFNTYMKLLCTKKNYARVQFVDPEGSPQQVCRRNGQLLHDGFEQ
jgi:hypothetical protein